MENDEYLEAEQVHVGRSNDGRLGLFSSSGYMKCNLADDENPEIVARKMGWRLVQAEQ